MINYKEINKLIALEAIGENIYLASPPVRHIQGIINWKL